MEARLDNKTHEQLRADLAPLGAERRVLRQRQAALRTQIRYAILDADDAGLGVSNIARLAGLTRRAVYDLLYEDEDE